MSDSKVVEFPKKKKQFPTWWRRHDLDLFVLFAMTAMDFGMWQKNWWAGMSLFMIFACVERFIQRLGVLRIERMVDNNKP